MEYTDTYNTIGEPSQGFYKDKGSKFIALAYPVSDEEEIKTILSDVKKQYYDARHHCYAWALDRSRERHRINDDGEPSGTAGKPIFGQILSHELTNILIVVVRYFGGTKLGVRGLINAYKGAAHDALQNAQVVTRVINDFYELQFGYQMMNDVMKILKDNNLTQVKHDFNLSCNIVFSVRQNHSLQIKQTFENTPGIIITLIDSK